MHFSSPSCSLLESELRHHKLGEWLNLSDLLFMALDGIQTAYPFPKHILPHLHRCSSSCLLMSNGTLLVPDEEFAYLRARFGPNTTAWRAYDLEENPKVCTRCGMHKVWSVHLTF